ncbi:MAG TPA: tripartite tricarboxylate transporter TctB family protein [Pseudolabrys sp.]|nr:tripartite tricarboxylate transporter TctB family protein [Pseudolabrys sp.]
MDKALFRSVLPYAVGLLVAAVLLYYAQQIQYTPRPGMIGPAFWPKMAIGLMAVVCFFEIGRLLLGFKSVMQGIAEALEKEEDKEEAPVYPGRLIGGIVLIIIYALVVDFLGFLLSTFLFIAAFMYIGGYRKHLAVWSISLGVTLLAALVFIRFAYVSLPRGVPPFDAITDFVRMMLGG